jgi:hypothetical protein
MCSKQLGRHPNPVALDMGHSLIENCGHSLVFSACDRMESESKPSVTRSVYE